MQAATSSTSTTKRPFSLGRTVMTHSFAGLYGSADIAETKGCELLARHNHCDWGDLSDDDKARNQQALTRKGRLLSSYTVRTADEAEHTVWVITDAGHGTTTVMLPADY